ncbi:hypothetical protein FA13DRAFT_931716 [Coprinellus micaceus]|uniref:Uncharacterized protein n=1 Tax=Coprinellus micaceus TaxID=71717 RepID=A0A4Y7TU40_COPMI|nr:hypothetical protein FA13DRAFT_931716 [Coprinellus micaceus]
MGGGRVQMWRSTLPSYDKIAIWLGRSDGLPKALDLISARPVLCLYPSEPCFSQNPAFRWLFTGRPMPDHLGLHAATPLACATLRHWINMVSSTLGTVSKRSALSLRRVETNHFLGVNYLVMPNLRHFNTEYPPPRWRNWTFSWTLRKLFTSPNLQNTFEFLRLFTISNVGYEVAEVLRKLRNPCTLGRRGNGPSPDCQMATTSAHRTIKNRGSSSFIRVIQCFA